MSYPRLASHLYNVPLLLTPAKAEVLERVFHSHVEGTTASLPDFRPAARADAKLTFGAGATRAQAGYIRTADGVAIIQVIGSLVQRGSGMDAASGLESYDNIAAQLSATFGDPMVRGILLEIDSSGGEVAGLFDLAAMVRAIDDSKPVVAHANEQAFSAAYGLGAAAGELYVAATGMVGSVGVMMLHVDQSSYDAKRGLVYTPIFAGARKYDFTPHAPLSHAAAASAQDMVDRVYETFVQHVATMRQMDPGAVRDTEAALLHPDQALATGMVDGVATLGWAMQKLREQIVAGKSGGQRSYGRAAKADSSTDDVEATARRILAAGKSRPSLDTDAIYAARRHKTTANEETVESVAARILAAGKRLSHDDIYAARRSQRNK